MLSSRQLISATLADLGQTIIAKQWELKVLQMERDQVLQVVFDLDDREEALRLQIRSLKDKANWEMRERKAALEASDAAEPPLRLPEPPLPGDEWKKAA